MEEDRLFASPTDEQADGLMPSNGRTVRVDSRDGRLSVDFSHSALPRIRVNSVSVNFRVTSGDRVGVEAQRIIDQLQFGPLTVR